MKVKHFHIRLNKENLLQDEETLNSFMQTVSVKKTATQLVSAGQANYWSILVFYLDTPPLEEHHENTSEKQPSFDPSTLNAEERNRYDALRTWRADTAGKENFPHYIIAHNSQLGAIAKLNPTTTNELLKVKGLGERKVAKYGDEIIAVFYILSDMQSKLPPFLVSSCVWTSSDTTSHTDSGDAANTGFASGGVTRYGEQFHSHLLHRNSTGYCSENPPLRQAAKRYALFKK